MRGRMGGMETSTNRPRRWYTVLVDLAVVGGFMSLVCSPFYGALFAAQLREKRDSVMFTIGTGLFMTAAFALTGGMLLGASNIIWRASKRRSGERAAEHQANSPSAH
jgi:hypothetical protein